MSNLSPLPINTSYKGLLNLEDSTTGITSTFQSIQDGLGNDTGIKISTNGLGGGNTYNFFKPAPAKYYGTGISSASMINPSAGWENDVNVTFFYDSGIHSYSAVTMICNTSSASESLEFAFYDIQYVENYGYLPKSKLTTTLTGDCTSTGTKTMTFGTPLSFSGQGPGLYFFVYRLVAPTTPAQRWGASMNSISSFAAQYSPQMGFVSNTLNQGFPSFWKTTVSTAFHTVLNFNGLTTFPTTWTTTNWDLVANGLTTAPYPGFLLHTIR